MRKKLFIILISLMAGYGAGAQTISRYLINAVGSISLGEHYSLTSTLGDISTGLLTNNEHFLTVGFQQPSIRAIFIPEPDEFVTIEPNPVRNYLRVNFLLDNFAYNIDVYDVNGQKRAAHMNFNIDSNHTFYVDFRDFPTGLFLVHVYSDSGELSRVFKIEKLR